MFSSLYSPTVFPVVPLNQDHEKGHQGVSESKLNINQVYIKGEGIDVSGCMAWMYDLMCSVRR